jgi:hypothetical protein
LSVITISDIKPPFAYTVGLMFSLQHPELIIFGLRDAGSSILRTKAGMICDGRRFDSPDEYEGVLEAGEIATRPVHGTQHEFYLGYAMGYCREHGRPGGLQAVEVFWPDAEGRFPFRPGCDERVWAAQPRLLWTGPRSGCYLATIGSRA